MVRLGNKISFTSEALDDIQNIWDYTTYQWSISQAEKYFNIISTTIQLIASNPKLFGRFYTKLGKGIRGYRAGKHIILYRVVSEGIEVVRIVHGSMNITHHLIPKN